jgi:hypothetical protein
VLAHYGAVAMPCRIQDPDRKCKVESGVGHAQADTRIHGTTKRQVAAMFAEEKPFLLLLPVEPFRYCPYGERVVHLD